MNASYSGRPIREMAFSSKLAASSALNSEACSAMSSRASSGEYYLPNNWLIRPRPIGNWYAVPEYMQNTRCW